MKLQYINDWKTWKRVCENHDYDPYETIEFSVDEGGGNSRDFEYTGDIPEKEE